MFATTRELIATTKATVLHCPGCELDLTCRFIADMLAELDRSDDQIPGGLRCTWGPNKGKEHQWTDGMENSDG